MGYCLRDRVSRLGRAWLGYFRTANTAQGIMKVANCFKGCAPISFSLASYHSRVVNPVQIRMGASPVSFQKLFLHYVAGF